ncbi:MAG: hypothetical protein ISN28_03320 [Ectothiorhodospiraceae bacterium AqS1]|nr:hypothetical protein [Ectothiorhodospiraceae bacterium AqS1]
MSKCQFGADIGADKCRFSSKIKIAAEDLFSKKPLVLTGEKASLDRVRAGDFGDEIALEKITGSRKVNVSKCQFDANKCQFSSKIKIATEDISSKKVLVFLRRESLLDRVRAGDFGGGTALEKKAGSRRVDMSTCQFDANKCKFSSKIKIAAEGISSKKALVILLRESLLRSSSKGGFRRRDRPRKEGREPKCRYVNVSI